MGQFPPKKEVRVGIIIWKEVQLYENVKMRYLYTYTHTSLNLTMLVFDENVE